MPPEACDLLTKNVGGTDTEDICLRTGRIGIYVSSRCQREFSPKIARWLMERDQPPAKPAAAPKKTRPRKIRPVLQAANP